MSRVLGIDVPTSVISIEGTAFQYIPQPSSVGSYGVTSAPEWPHPTALAFESRTVVIEKVGAVMQVPADPVPPELLVRMVEHTVKNTVQRVAQVLRDKGFVSDTRGLLSDIHPQKFGPWTVTTVCHAWPAVPGVTTRYEDVTL